MNRGLLLIFFCFAITLANCVDSTPYQYQARPAPIPNPELMPIWKRFGSVGIGADPYIETSRQKAIFFADFTEAGILAIQILVKNLGDSEVQLKPTEFRLQAPNGEKLAPATKTQIVKKVRRLGPSSYTRSIDGPVRWKDYVEKEFKDGVVKKGETKHGFVFFNNFPEGRIFKKATLIIPVVEINKAKRIILQLPLPGLDVE